MADEARKTKVFWSETEKEALCEEAARLLYTLAASSRMDALNKAQLNKLSEHRRRKVAALTGMPWFQEGTQRELQKLRDAVHREAENEVPPDLTELGLAALYPLLRKRLVSELASFITDVLQEVKWPDPDNAKPEEQVVASTPLGLVKSLLQPGVASGAPKKLSVLVVGLKGSQVQEIRRELGSKLDLRFFGADESKEKLRFMCEQTDFSVALTGFISHSHEDILTKRSRKYLRSAGGLTRLKELLSGLQGRELAAA